ncbi:MAG: LamG-like jellyroll fold domain-containing protein, partial [Planctomycetota bacterium]
MQLKHILAATLLISTTSAVAVGRDWRDSETGNYDGMPYRLYLPKDYDDSQEYPIVMFLHGGGDVGTDNIDQVDNGIERLIDRTYEDYPSLLLAPQCPGTSGRWFGDRQRLGGVFDAVKHDYSVDESRVYLTGYSAGGDGITDYTYRAPYMFGAAAVAPIGGAPLFMPPSASGPVTQVPTWLFHGNADGTVPVARSRDYYLSVTGEPSIVFNESAYGYPTAVSGPIRYTEITGGGHATSWIYNHSDTALYDWMFAQSTQPLPEPPSVLRDDFDDDSVVDGSPATWLPLNAGSDFELTVTDGSMVISGAGVARIEPLLRDSSDVSVRTQVRLLEGAAVGILARDAGGGIYLGSQVGILTREDGGGYYYGRVFAPSYSQNANLERNGPYGDLATTPVDFDITQEDVILQLDAVGDQIELWAWPAGTPMPSEPLFSVVDNTHDFGKVSFLVTSKDFEDLRVTSQQPASAAFRYVIIEDIHIPEHYTHGLLIWDGLGEGDWGDEPRWRDKDDDPVGVYPKEFTRVMVNTNTLTVSVDHAARSLEVASGAVAIAATGALTVSEDVDIASGATLHVAGTLNALSLTTAGTTTFAEGSLGTVDTVNVTDGTTTLSSPNIATINAVGGILNTAADVTELNVDGGAVITSGDVTAQNVKLTAGAMHLGDGTRLYVTSMQISGGTMNTGAGHLVVSDTLKIGDNTTISISGATFAANGLNLADPTEPDNITLTGGRLAVAGGTIAPPGAIAIWTFKEGGGTTTADLSAAGNDHPGTLSGTLSVPEWFSDDADHSTALEFVDGNYVEIAETDDIHLGRPFAIAMWIKTSEKGRTLLGKGQGDHVTHRSEKDLYIDATGGRLTLVGQNIFSASKMVGATNVADDDWHHVVVTYNGSQADQAIYFDGENDQPNRGYGSTQDGGPVVRLGWAETRYGDGHYSGYVGLMDEVYLYDRSLSAAEVADLYASFGKVVEPLPNTNLRVIADSKLHLDTASAEATLGNLTLDPGVALEVTGATVGFNHVTVGDGSSIQGALSVGGTLSVGNSPGRLDVVGGLTMQDGSIYEWELGSGTTDLVAVDGHLTLMDGWTLRLADTGGTCVASDQLDLFT